MKDYIVDYGMNEKGFWQKYRSGKIEQWGYLTAPGYGPYTLEYPLPFTREIQFVKTSVVTSDTFAATTNYPVRNSIGLNSMIVKGAGFSNSGTLIKGFYFKIIGF